MSRFQTPVHMTVFLYVDLSMLFRNIVNMRLEESQ